MALTEDKSAFLREFMKKLSLKLNYLFAFVVNFINEKLHEILSIIKSI